MMEDFDPTVDTAPYQKSFTISHDKIATDVEDAVLWLNIPSRYPEIAYKSPSYRYTCYAYIDSIWVNTGMQIYNTSDSGDAYGAFIYLPKLSASVDTIIRLVYDSATNIGMLSRPTNLRAYGDYSSSNLRVGALYRRYYAILETAASTYCGELAHEDGDDLYVLGSPSANAGRLAKGYKVDVSSSEGYARIPQNMGGLTEFTLTIEAVGDHEASAILFSNRTDSTNCTIEMKAGSARVYTDSTTYTEVTTDKRSGLYALTWKKNGDLKLYVDGEIEDTESTVADVVTKSSTNDYLYISQDAQSTPTTSAVIFAWPSLAMLERSASYIKFHYLSLTDTALPVEPLISNMTAPKLKKITNPFPFLGGV